MRHHLRPFAFRLCLSLVLGLALGACATRPDPAPGEAPGAAPTPCDVPLEGHDAFERAGLEGVFVLRDDATGCTRSTDDHLADTPLRPQSTFKIPNALIGLETGVIEGAAHSWRWGRRTARARRVAAGSRPGRGASGVVRALFSGRRPAQSARDRMDTWLRVLQYGNEDTAGPIDAFWLDGGPLRITPRGQVVFVHRMLAGAMPVRREHVALLWDRLLIERTSRGSLRGKTGLGTLDGRAIGWLVGYSEVEDRRFVYATFVRSREGADLDSERTRLMPLRKSLTRILLERAGAL
jgi:beta-lactamase class D